MLTRLHITLLLGTAVVVWAVTLLLRGVAVTADLFIPFGIAVTALTLLCVGFNRWCWRFGLFKGWLVQRPWLQGIWSVTLQSKWIDPKTNQQIGPIECFMVIHQTYSTLSLRLFTPESSSKSVSAAILCSEDGLFQIASTYLNEPNSELRGQRSEIHYGALLLNIHGDPASTASGHYWTDRMSSGTLTLKRQSKNLASGYEEAAALTGSATEVP